MPIKRHRQSRKRSPILPRVPQASAPEEAPQAARTLSPAGTITPARVLQLQRTVGNRRTTQIVGQAPVHPIQRYMFNGTDWNDTKSAKVSEGGAGGVIIMDDGSTKLVVKPGEELSAEVIIAANLTNQALQGGEKSSGWSLGTPNARVAYATEAAWIKRIATNRLGTQAADQRKARILDKLDRPTTIVFTYASGEDFSEIIKTTEVLKTKKSLFGREKQVENKDSSLVQMWSEPGPMQSLGKASAIDIFMGNGDRLLALVNYENWKVDAEKRAIQLIDNVNNTSRDFFAPPSGKGTAQQGFKDWMAQQWVKDFVDNKLDSITDLVMTNLMDTLNKWGPSPEFAALSNEQVEHIRTSFEEHQPEMKQWFTQGLQQGKSLLLTALTPPEQVVEGVPDSKRQTALTAVYARRYALQGLGASAWPAAEAQVAKLLDPNQGQDARTGITIGNNRKRAVA